MVHLGKSRWLDTARMEDIYKEQVAEEAKMHREKLDYKGVCVSLTLSYRLLRSNMQL